MSSNNCKGEHNYTPVSNIKNNKTGAMIIHLVCSKCGDKLERQFTPPANLIEAQAIPPGALLEGLGIPGRR